MSASPERSGAMDDRGFRLDIQGVRGFALVLVLLAHAEFPLAEGGFVGLDVFYVLSGFLITGLILKEVERTGKLSVLRFYARRARRLLPLAVTVLAVIAGGALVLFGPVRGHQVAGDVIAAALYVVNWRFMAEAVDYFAFDDGLVSPVQHYWSLSVEEQFYLLWPLLILLVLAFARRAGWSPRRLLWIIVAPVGLASFAYGVWFAGYDPQQAYFSTLARIWEIALGCALALALPAGIRMPRRLSAVMTAGGLAALAGSAVLFSEDVPYPGWHALAPTLGTAAIIVAGTSTVASGPIRLLSLAPMQYLGRISYAYYLWHWPALVFAAALWGPMTVTQNVLVTLAAWLPTILSHHMIEERFRHSRSLARRPRRAIALGVSLSATAVVLGVSLSAVQPTVTIAEGSEVQGARAVKSGRDALQRSARVIRPTPRNAREDRGRAYKDGCQLDGKSPLQSPPCIYGDRSSSTTVVNLGDSHGLMYFPTLNRLANRRDWRLTNLTRTGCTLADVSFRDRCDTWRENSLRRIERERPDLVVLSHAGDFRYDRVRDMDKGSRRARNKPLEDGLVRTLERIRATGARAVVIRDMARTPDDLVDCVAENMRNLVRCAFRPRRPRGDEFDLRAARRVKGVRPVDPLSVLCPRKRCPAVIGNVLVYRNNYHLTATFARTMAPWLGRRLSRQLRKVN